MDEIISIIAPAYNHENYIIDALSSVSRQSYYNKELIIIDDSSNDRTPEIIEKYINRDFIKYAFPAGVKFIVHDKNQNAHNTINEGINLSHGNYISIINTDDMYEINRLETMYTALKRNNGHFAFSKVCCINDKCETTEYPLFNSIPKEVRRYPSPSFALTNWNIAVGTGNFVFSKELFNTIGGFDSNYHFIHDWDFVLKAILLCEPVYVPDTTYLYRFHETNTIKQIDKDALMKQKKEKEVYQVLKHFLQALLDGHVSNPIMKDLNLWDYYFEYVSQTFASNIWHTLKEV